MLKCSLCGASSFRSSRFRLRDIDSLVFHLQLPVRCRVCENRQFVGFREAMKIREGDRIRHAKQRAREAPKDSDKGSAGKQAS